MPGLRTGSRRDSRSWPTAWPSSAVPIGRSSSGRSGASAGLFDVQVSEAEGGGLRVSWTQRPEWQAWAALSEGHYLLRTNLSGWDPADLWKTYIQLTQAEAAFRIQKSELALRPIWHQLEERVQPGLCSLEDA
jgi:hypothetical protein